jgi:hypothetical protein
MSSLFIEALDPDPHLRPICNPKVLPGERIDQPLPLHDPVL